MTEIKQFIVGEFVPGATADDLDADCDLFEHGVVDSLGLLRLIAWVGERYSLPIEDLDLTPDDFRSVNAIQRFVGNARAVRANPI